MRGCGSLVVCGAALAAAAPAWAVNPPGELGKVTQRHEKRIVGREERGNTFRQPGSVLEGAKSDPARVDPEVLAARQRALYGGATFTDRLPVQDAAADGGGPRAPGAGSSAARDRPAPGPAATGASPGTRLRTILLGVAGLIVLAVVARTVLHRRVPPEADATAKPSPSPPRRMSARGHRWVQRDLSITLGHRDE